MSMADSLRLRTQQAIPAEPDLAKSACLRAVKFGPPKGPCRSKWPIIGLACCDEVWPDSPAAVCSPNSQVL